MYINKNKKSVLGFSLVELIVSMFILSIIFQVVCGYLKNIAEDKKRIEQIQKFKKGLTPIFLKLQEFIYEGANYKIYPISSDEYEYTNNTGKGKVLLLEKIESIVPLKYEYSIYSIRDRQLISELGYKEGTKIKIYKRKGETILKNIDLEFNLADYGIKIEGDYLNEKFKENIYH